MRRRSGKGHGAKPRPGKIKKIRSADEEATTSGPVRHVYHREEGPPPRPRRTRRKSWTAHVKEQIEELQNDRPLESVEDVEADQNWDDFYTENPADES